MKKVLSITGPLCFSAHRSLHFLLPPTCVLSNWSRLAQFSTHKTVNILFEKGDLNITEIQSPNQVRKKDSAARAFDETLQLNANLGWRSSNTEEFVANNETSSNKKTSRAEQRIIMFKANTKEVLEKYPTARPILDAAENVGFPIPVICALIFTHPQISTFDPERVGSNLSQLLKLGFHVAEIKNMVRKYPDLLEYEGYDIFDTIEAWRTASISERILCELFSMHPLLFSIPNDEAVRRLNRINYMMMSKINRVKSVIEKNPSIMDGDWNRVEENFQYLYTTMRITEKDISRSTALSLPLSFIKLRHTFLERCGEYIRPKMKEVTGLTQRKNPYLTSIVDTSDNVFAVKVAKVSLDEYLVFKKLMKFDETQPLESIFHNDS